MYWGFVQLVLHRSCASRGFTYASAMSGSEEVGLRVRAHSEHCFAAMALHYPMVLGLNKGHKVRKKVSKPRHSQ